MQNLGAVIIKVLLSRQGSKCSVFNDTNCMQRAMETLPGYPHANHDSKCLLSFSRWAVQQPLCCGSEPGPGSNFLDVKYQTGFSLFVF